jgi:coproporphyrinogen III oxidase
MSASDPLPGRKARASAFFESLRDRLCAGLEALEDEAGPPLYAGPPGRFERVPWRRGDGSKDEGGGVGSILKGRLIEKAGVHVSAVHGEFSEAFRGRVRGAEKDPRFWAGGVSVIVHPRNPRVPAAHMNTRMVATTETWFGGGSDLTPVLDTQRRDDAEDALAFHAALKAACDKHGEDLYPRYKAWCDDYFFLPHRNERRGVGGIFFDDLSTGDWEADFAFAQRQANAFVDVYLAIAARRMTESWSAAEREEQLVRRGRYVEFNLLYDRGTTFGLKTGGNVATILSSLPPVVKWP